MNYKLFALLSLVGFAAACTSVTTEKDAVDDSVAVEKVAPPTTADTTAFKAFFSSFQKSFLKNDPKALDAFIDQEAGLYIFESHGAMPEMRRITSFSQYKVDSATRPLLKPGLDAMCTLSFKVYPAFSCDTYSEKNSGYMEDGCFAGPGEQLLNSKILDHVERPAAEVAAAKKQAAKVHFLVLQTRTHRMYYFGRSGNSWKLIFLNVIEPCSA
jgi:hypothetical protein